MAALSLWQVHGSHDCSYARPAQREADQKGPHEKAFHVLASMRATRLVFWRPTQQAEEPARGALLGEYRLQFTQYLLLLAFWQGQVGLIPLVIWPHSACRLVRAGGPITCLKQVRSLTDFHASFTSFGLVFTNLSHLGGSVRCDFSICLGDSSLIGDFGDVQTLSNPSSKV